MKKNAAMAAPPYWQQILPTIQKGFPSEYGAYLSDPNKVQFVSAPESGVSGDPFAYIKLLDKKPGMSQEEIKSLDVDGDGTIDVVFLVVPKIERSISEEVKKELPQDVSQKTIHQIMTDPNVQEQVRTSMKDYVANIYRQLILHELGHKHSAGDGGEASADQFAERFKLAKENMMINRLVKMAKHLESLGESELAHEVSGIISMAQERFRDPKWEERLTFGPIVMDGEEIGLPTYTFDEDVITAKPPSQAQTPQVITEISNGTIKDKLTGDAFRAWMHKEHPTEAKQLQLDPPSDKTRWDNAYVLSALRMFLPEWNKKAPVAIAEYNLLKGRSVSPLNLPEVDVGGLADKMKQVDIPSGMSDITQKHMEGLAKSVDKETEVAGKAETQPVDRVTAALSGMNPLSIPKLTSWLKQRKPGQEVEQLRVLKELSLSQGSSRDSIIGMLAGLPGSQRFHPEEAKNALGFLSANRDKVSKLLEDATKATQDKSQVFESEADDDMKKEASNRNELIKMFVKNLSSNSTLIRR